MATGGPGYGPGDFGSRYRHLDYASDYPELKHKKSKPNNNKVIDNKTGFEVLSFPEFYIMSRNDENKELNLNKVNPFYIETALNQQAGPGTDTKRLKDGTLLIKCKNEQQAKKLLSIQKLGSEYNVTVKEHGFLNETQGMIYCHDAKYLSEEEILNGLQAQKQKVTSVYKMKKMEKGILTPTPMCILTFKSTQLPESIKFGFLRVNVERYIPNPMKCKNCFEYGHSKKYCKNDRLCLHCSLPFHEPTPCNVSKPKCVNCNDEHDNKSKKCEKYLREYGIQKIKVIDRLSYIESKRKFNALYPVSSQSSFSKPIQSNPAQAQSYNTFETNPLISLSRTYSQQASSSHPPITTEISNTHLNSDTKVIPTNKINIPTENTNKTHVTNNNNEPKQDNNTIETISQTINYNHTNTQKNTKNELYPYNTRSSKVASLSDESSTSFDDDSMFS